QRKELARHFGADVVIDYTEEDPIHAILKLTNGQGVDAAIEALGAAGTFAACVKATRPGGTISNVGYHGHGESGPIPRAEWGIGRGDKTIRTGLGPGDRAPRRRPSMQHDVARPPAASVASRVGLSAAWMLAPTGQAGFGSWGWRVNRPSGSTATSTARR